jgi:hypothetical protein
MLTQSLRFGGFSLFVQRQLLRTIQHEMIVNYLVSFGVLFLQHTFGSRLADPEALFRT